MSEGDIHILQSLATLARHFDADILITHVTTENMEKNHQQKIDQFLREVTCKINYHKIYYKDLNYSSVHEGLNSLVESSYIDILAMVHRRHDFLTDLFKGSDTVKMVKYRNIPLLVFSEAESARRPVWQAAPQGSGRAAGKNRAGNARRRGEQETHAHRRAARRRL